MLFALGILASAARAQEVPPAMYRIDHIILGAASLELGVAEFQQRTGVTPTIGGRHPGRGTQNALVGLGEGTYLEIAAPSGEPDRTDSAAYLATLTRLTPSGWALRTDDLGATIQHLRRAGHTVAGPVPGGRTRPDGTVLSWITAHITSDSTELLPFFIQWDDAISHPSLTAPSGCRLTSIGLAAADPASLRSFLDLTHIAVEVGTAPAAGMTFTLACPPGTVSFRL
jgi:hypothetical protein